MDQVLLEPCVGIRKVSRVNDEIDRVAFGNEALDRGLLVRGERVGDRRACVRGVALAETIRSKHADGEEVRRLPTLRSGIAYPMSTTTAVVKGRGSPAIRAVVNESVVELEESIL